MYNKTRQEIFCINCLQNFSILDALENQRNAYFKVNVRQSIKMPEKGSSIKMQFKFKKYSRKIKSSFVIYSDTKIERKEHNSDQSYTDVLRSYYLQLKIYKLACDDNFSVTGHNHVTGKYRGSVHRDQSINLKLTHEVPVTFHNLRL